MITIKRFLHHRKFIKEQIVVFEILQIGHTIYHIVVDLVVNIN